MIPGLYVFAAVGIVAGALGFAGGWSTQGWRLGGQISAMKAEQLTAVNAAIAGARTQEQARFTKVQEATNAATKRAAIARADADSARGALAGLRDAIRNRPVCVPGDPASTGTERADPVGELLSECSGAYQDLARKADGHASDAVMLRDSWPR